MSGMKKVFLAIGLFFLATACVDAAVGHTIISDPVSEIVCALKNAFVQIVGALSAVIFAAAGLRWIASRDDPGKRKQAKDTMVHAIIGLVIVAIADALVGAMGTFDTCAVS